MTEVLVLFASKSDEKTYEPILKFFGKNKISHELVLASAHKTPAAVDAALAHDYKCVISGAGLAAALPGYIASKIFRPVIGVPCSGNYQGLDALLSIAQMPPGIPVLAVGVNRGDMAAENCRKMLKKYDSVTVIGDKSNEVVKKASEILKKFEVISVFDEKPNPRTVNIEFTYFDEPVEKKDELVIYCPLLMEKDDNAEASLNFLKHTSHGIWVGINNGVNAAIAAVEIMNYDNSFEELLTIYRRDLARKVLEGNRKKGSAHK